MRMTFIIIVVWLLGLFVGALAHESDMRRCIQRYGHTRHSGWLGKISGRVE